MKKGLIITAVMLLVGLGMTVPVYADFSATPMVKFQEEVTYDEIEKEKLPEAVTNAIQEGYSGHEIAKVFLGSDGSYKVKLAKGDEKVAVFFNSSGEFLKVKELEDKKDKAPR